MAPITTGTVFQERYEILEKLGEGGFGQVYRARQLATQHEVAIKVLHAVHAASEKHVARFQREMQLCAQLYHPNIVRLIDSGRAGPDVLYTVFEYVPGRTLMDVLHEQGALPPWEVAHLMLQVLDALACAHNRGVVHRDLKPQNIMVTTTGVRRNALVLDFGLGTLSEDSREDLTRITRTQEMLGTPSYAAPEQLRGEGVTALSDLYSWGLIFLECLTGRRVVDGATLQQVVYKQLGPEPVQLPPWLEDHRLGRLLRKVTHKQVPAREISAQSVLRELGACAAEGWPVAEGQSAVLTPVGLPLQDTLVTRPEGERRQLTAVCCSVRLLSEEAREGDEEDLDRLLRSLNTACAEVARRYDAHVGSILGEWVLFYFGYPKAQEDDARRAARAALEMVGRMEQRGAELARERKGRLEFRVGIHTGLVISQEPRMLGPSDLPALVGATPNHAVRLEMQAPAGTVLISQATSRLLRGHFAFEPLAAAPPAGNERLAALRLLHEYRGQANSQLVEGLLVKPLYGRAQELEVLKQRWWQAAAGTGQSILLTGEPGIGKSRLVQELTRQVRGTPQTLLECRCAPEGSNVALYPMVDLLERLLGVSPDWKPEQTVASLEALLSQYGFNLPEVMPLFLGLLSVKGGSERYPPLGVAPQRAKELTLDALTSLFFEMAQQQQPVLLLVEDLHWADPTTLELLAPLVKDVSSARICLVLTARPEFSVPWTTSYHLQLSRLDRQGMEQMVRGLTQDKPLPPELVEKLLERTDGVPLFVEELTRVVTESMPSGQDTSSRQLSHSQLSIPSTLRDSLMARLDRLGSARELAQLASALGREFSFEVLKAISQREEADFQRELKVLVDADLVHRRRGVRSPTYLFKHALIRDTAYESMLKPLRRQVHARIAATLEAHFPELVQTRPDLLATHHAAAEQKRQALGYVQKAAMAALMRSANQEAVAYITEALGWLEAIEDERERAQLELGLNGILTPAMMVTRGWADARIKALVERSQQLLAVLGDLPQTVPTLWGLWLFHYTRSQHEPAWSCAERLLAMAERAGDSGLKVMALNALGNTAVTEGKLAQTQGYYEQVLALYNPEEHAKLAVLFGLDARALAAMCLSLVKWLQGHWEQALDMVQAAHRWGEESKHVVTQGLAYLYHLTLLHGRGEREQLLKVADAGLEMARRYGMPTQAMYYNAFRCWALRDLEGVRRALTIPDNIGQDIGRTYYKSMLVELELEAGRPDAALLLVAELIGWGEANGETYMIPNLLRLQALALRGRGEHRAAEAALLQAIEIARTQGARMLELKALIDLAQLLKERGRLAEVRQRLALFVQSFAEGTDMPDIIRARALIGGLPA